MRIGHYSFVGSNPRTVIKQIDQRAETNSRLSALPICRLMAACLKWFMTRL